MAEPRACMLLTVFLLFVIDHEGVVLSTASDDLRAEFNMGGIKGSVVFSQPQTDGATAISVNLLGVNETLKWSIRQLPMIYDGNAVLSCSASAIGELFDPKMAKMAANYDSSCQNDSNTKFHACAVGDLSRMLGNITADTAKKNHTNENLTIPTRGKHSIMGRTLVLHSGAAPKACALITPVSPMKTAVAVFRAPIGGFVYFRQVEGKQDTTIFVDLFFVNNADSQGDFTWKINQGLLDTDASDSTTYCKTLGELFNPVNNQSQNCNQEMHRNCPVGDLASKHGNVTVSLASARQSTTKAAFTDSNLPLSGANSVIGQSIVLFPVNDPRKPIACAKIVTLMTQVTEATFTADVNDGVSGHFRFTQRSPFDPTLAEISLRGLQKLAGGYHVHAYPSPYYKTHLTASDSCSGFVAGNHWNPFHVDIKGSPANETGTNDEYEVGDLSGKYGSFQNLAVFTKNVVDYNLPMFGRNSIQGRSILIHKKEKNARWVCSNLKPVFDVGTTFVMTATANFTGPHLKGMIVMDQYISSEENMASPESSIFIEVNYPDLKAPVTEDHKWQIDLNPVNDDTTADINKRCASLKNDFNPYEVFVEGTYSSSCRPTNMLRCETGDLTKKHASVKVNGGRQFYSDISLPLFGRNSVIGRGISIYEKDMGQNRIACANIKAMSALFLESSLEFVKQDPFSSYHFVDVVSKALGIPKWRLFNIRIDKAEVDKCQVVKFGIIGNANQVAEVRTVFQDTLKSNPDAFGQYKPSNACDAEVPSSGGVRGCFPAIFGLAIAAMMAKFF
ncbi:uncharacterized protein LOC114964254 isoform X1 [Acropora millepora]|uniref:uncharacterized protein LOC114964254 isoform X1 n=1 Tax=Acropora millepora TaxID=45264 RepID=UPI001CF17A03|nr:uncharacterized protein LOC114964254 isoform X1 [Acropora millepora]